MKDNLRILIITLSGIGDALMFSPALRLLRRHYPTATIDMLCMFAGVEELYRRNTDINNVLRWDFLKASLSESLRFVLRLRGKYDVSINVYPANRWEYNVIQYLIGAPVRLGHEYNHLNFVSLYFLNNKRIREDDALHNVEENARLVELLGVPHETSLPPLVASLTPADEQAATEWLAKHDINASSLLVGFHAGSAEFKNHVRRRWAPEKYAALGLKLIRERNATILLFGGPDELRLNETLNSAMEQRGFIVQTPFMTTAALMKRCRLFVCNDTGLMHVAAALQIPIVTIFAFTNPVYVHPWQCRYTLVRHDLPCSPCFYYSPRYARCQWKTDQFRCITHIEVEEVWAAVQQMLHE